MKRNIAIALKIIIFLLSVRTYTHNLDVIVYLLTTFIQHHIDLVILFYKVYKLHFSILYWKYKRRIADIEYSILVLKHDFKLWAAYFREITTVTLRVLTTKVLKSFSNPLSLISLVWFLNYITLPHTILLEIFLDAFYSVKELNMEDVIAEIASNNNMKTPFAPSISKEEEETLNKVLSGVKTNSKAENLDAEDTLSEEKQETSFKEKLKAYNLYTAYLSFCVASVIICQILKARRGGD
jgi:hypothetical protein